MDNQLINYGILMIFKEQIHKRKIAEENICKKREVMEMEIDMVTLFEDNCSINNSNNARVIELEETLILQLRNNELIGIYNSEIIEYSLWIYDSNNRNNIS
eukprot:152378_1